MAGYLQIISARHANPDAKEKSPVLALKTMRREAVETFVRKARWQASFDRTHHRPQRTSSDHPRSWPIPSLDLGAFSSNTPLDFQGFPWSCLPERQPLPLWA